MYQRDYQTGGEVVTISRSTELGTITLSDLIFAEVIERSFNQKECKGRVWPATSRGRLIGTDQKSGIQEFAHEIEVKMGPDDNAVSIEFSIIIRFGTSIKKITGLIGDYIAEAIKEDHGERPIFIKIRISGVKSKQIARRDVEVLKSYGTV